MKEGKTRRRTGSEDGEGQERRFGVCLKTNVSVVLSVSGAEKSVPW